jgi:LmbE family N-acetylglucosaminyl deacetylase
VTILVIAPHPDDETLGCGGTLLKLSRSGIDVHWLIVTSMTPDMFTPARIASRDAEILAVGKAYGFSSLHRLDLPTTKLDTLPLGQIVGAAEAVFKAVKPAMIFLPYAGDAHSDHAVTFKACAALTKSFRHPELKRVLIYETLSETDFGIDPDDHGFRPNSFSDISGRVDEKIEIMSLYQGEMGQHPFPRSNETIRALATVRGAVAGTPAAEGFIAIKEIW